MGCVTKLPRGKNEGWVPFCSANEECKTFNKNTTRKTIFKSRKMKTWDTQKRDCKEFPRGLTSSSARRQSITFWIKLHVRVTWQSHQQYPIWAQTFKSKKEFQLSATFPVFNILCSTAQMGWRSRGVNHGGVHGVLNTHCVEYFLKIVFTKTKWLSMQDACPFSGFMPLRRSMNPFTWSHAW